MRSSRVLVAYPCVALVCLVVAGCLGGWDDYRAGPDASGGAGGTDPTGGAGGGGAAPPGRCGGAAMLADDFTMLDTAESVWDIDGAVLIDAGELVLRPVANAMEYNWNALSSAHFYDLRSDAVSIEIKRMVNTATNSRVYFSAYDDVDSAVWFTQGGGTLTCSKRVDHMEVELSNTPYDPVAHRFWRMREEGGTLRWETSADGMAWATLASSSSVFDLSRVRVQFAAATEGGNPDPGEARIDNLTGVAEKGGWCKVSTLKDDFDDGVTADQWLRSYFDGACQHAENGELVFSVPPDERGACYYTGASAFDLTDDALSVKLPLPPSAEAFTSAFLSAYVNGEVERKIEVLLSHGQLLFREHVGESTKVFGDLPFDPIQHLYWRLRESAGQVFWETSPDGKTWKVGGQSPTPFPVTALDVTVGIEHFEPRPALTEVHFDSLNTP
jgi:hypothetical protein